MSAMKWMEENWIVPGIGIALLVGSIVITINSMSAERRLTTMVKSQNATIEALAQAKEADKKKYEMELSNALASLSSQIEELKAQVGRLTERRQAAQKEKEAAVAKINKQAVVIQKSTSAELIIPVQVKLGIPPGELKPIELGVLFSDSSFHALALHLNQEDIQREELKQCNVDRESYRQESELNAQAVSTLEEKVKSTVKAAEEYKLGEEKKDAALQAAWNDKEAVYRKEIKKRSGFFAGVKRTLKTVLVTAPIFIAIGAAL